MLALRNATSLTITAIALVAASCSISERALERRGDALIGQTEREVRQRLGTPDRQSEKTYGPMMGPGEGLDLEFGQSYEEWIYDCGDKQLFLFLRDDDNGGEKSVIGSGVHVEGRVY